MSHSIDSPALLVLRRLYEILIWLKCWVRWAICLAASEVNCG